MSSKPPTQKQTRELFESIIAQDISAVRKFLEDFPGHVDVVGTKPALHKGSTPLIMAIRSYASDIARLLLEEGADVNFEATSRGHVLRPIEFAVNASCAPGGEEAMREIVEILLEFGADANGPSYIEGNVLTFAINRYSNLSDNCWLIELLLKNGAELKDASKQFVRENIGNTDWAIPRFRKIFKDRL